jgi:hypothetical protein
MPNADNDNFLQKIKCARTPRRGAADRASFKQLPELLGKPGVLSKRLAPTISPKSRSVTQKLDARGRTKLMHPTTIRPWASIVARWKINVGGSPIKRRRADARPLGRYLRTPALIAASTRRLSRLFPSGPRIKKAATKGSLRDLQTSVRSLFYRALGVRNIAKNSSKVNSRSLIWFLSCVCLLTLEHCEGETPTHVGLSPHWLMLGRSGCGTDALAPPRFNLNIGVGLSRRN